MRKLLTGALAAALLVGAIAPAAAGGAVWETDRRYYRPGETGTAQTAVAWEHNPTLGRPADGPYFAYLVAGGSDCAGCVPPDALLLGEIVVEPGAFKGADGARYGPNRAAFDFVVPDLPPGLYEIVHCNDPCDRRLGDITWGELRVLGGPPRVVEGTGRLGLAPQAV